MTTNDLMRGDKVRVGNGTMVWDVVRPQWWVKDNSSPTGESLTGVTVCRVKADGRVTIKTFPAFRVFRVQDRVTENAIKKGDLVQFGTLGQSVVVDVKVKNGRVSVSFGAGWYDVQRYGIVPINR